MAERYVSFALNTKVEALEKNNNIKIDLNESTIDTVIYAFIQFMFFDLQIDFEDIKLFFKDTIIRNCYVNQYVNSKNRNKNNNNNDDDDDNDQDDDENEKMDIMQIALKQKADIKEFVKQINKSPDFAQKVFHVFKEWLEKNE